MAETLEHDVLVTGSGPAGLRTALEIKRSSGGDAVAPHELGLAHHRHVYAVAAGEASPQDRGPLPHREPGGAPTPRRRPVPLDAEPEKL
ncbi:hypothetical protein CF15_01290 [Pyrodictium occultum]|uniref:Uncharacterized protein n=1 Tax=Pyrodictium occultum TaxID=2309 RepID=A0A0V8RTW4_PYROC|nr:hypothetical protein [Pyrodictium occultum]KSW11505.1 hypothetical protein CF15_01290 [Pyrodictium occultum]